MLFDIVTPLPPPGFGSRTVNWLHGQVELIGMLPDTIGFWLVFQDRDAGYRPVWPSAIGVRRLIACKWRNATTSDDKTRAY
jgi:hypothetical protein